MSSSPTLLLLGEPRLRRSAADGDATVALTGSTSTTVLALLAREPGRVVTLDRLLEQVWPEPVRDSGRGRVHVQISRLRNRLDGSGLEIASRHGGYVLEGPSDMIDVHRFGTLTGTAREAAAVGDWSAVLASSSVAMDLWRGEPFSGMRAPAIDLERAHLVERRRLLLQARCQALLAVDAPDEALLTATDLRESDPYDEFPVWASMTALVRLGRRVAALDVFDQHRRLVAEDLGLDPGRELRELQLSVLQDEAEVAPRRDISRRDLGREIAVPSRADDGVAVKAAEPLVGRDKERARIDAMVSELRAGRPAALLMEGEAGIGRTALARYAAVAAEREGLRVVRARGSNPAAPPLAIWGHVFDRLGLGTEPFPRPSEPTSVAIGRMVEALLAAVRDRPTVLVLDDLHRVDDADVQALQYLVGEIWHEPLAVVATREFHGVPSTAAKELAWTRLSQEHLSTMLDLRPLGLADVASLAGVPEHAAELLLRRTGGNPRLLRQLLSSPTRDTAAAELPCGVVSIVRSRLVAVPPGTRSLVTEAAAAGPRFDPYAVGKRLGLEVGSVASALRSAMEVGLVTPLRHDTWWAFRHEVEREGVLDLTAALRHTATTASGESAVAGGIAAC